MERSSQDLIRTFKERKKERKKKQDPCSWTTDAINSDITRKKKKKTFYVSKQLRAGLIYSAWTGPRNSSLTHFRENADVADPKKRHGLRLMLAFDQSRANETCIPFGNSLVWNSVTPIFSKKFNSTKWTIFHDCFAIISRNERWLFFPINR